jgi:uncharacterized protein YuzE
MRSPYLEVTFRHGRALAAYLYLPRTSGDKSHRVEAMDAGLLVDYTADGKPIGIEITSPVRVSTADLNRVLTALHVPVLADKDIAPLRVA